MILFVGDKPSPSMERNAPAFRGARCEKRLISWIHYIMGYTPLHEALGLGYVLHAAVVLNRVESRLERTAAYCSERGFPIIALDNNASKDLADLGLEHFKLPHPSGRNRKLNDEAWVLSQLDAAKNYVESKGFGESFR